MVTGAIAIAPGWQGSGRLAQRADPSAGPVSIVTWVPGGPTLRDTA